MREKTFTIATGHPIIGRVCVKCQAGIAAGDICQFASRTPREIEDRNESVDVVHVDCANRDGSKTIAASLPKTVHLDKVTARNILDALRQRESYEGPDAQLREDIDALASAIQVAEIDAPGMSGAARPCERCGVGFNFEGMRCVLSAGHPGRHEFTR